MKKYEKIDNYKLINLLSLRIFSFMNIYDFSFSIYKDECDLTKKFGNDMQFLI